MEFMSLLVSVAFVFTIAALSQVSSLKREVEKLKEEYHAKKYWLNRLFTNTKNIIEHTHDF